jgi:hypothetical protein
MNFVNITMQRPKFAFKDSKCIGRDCFYPDQVGGNIGSCGYRSRHGCPNLLPSFDKALAAKRKAAGWRVSK